MKPKTGLTKSKRDLLIQLESIIGNECYNSNIMNWGPGGMFEGAGREFRYPITFRDASGAPFKQRAISPQVTDEMLRGGYYAFGANELHVIAGLELMLDFLEREYGLQIESGSSIHEQ